MRLRLGLLLAGLAVFLAAAAPAFAVNPAPSVIAPADGQSFYRGDAIRFSADDGSGDNTKVWVAVSSSSALQWPEDIIADDVWFGQLTGGSSWSVTWDHTANHLAGTYYFQIYATDDLPCNPISECYRPAAVMSLQLIDAPSAPSLTSPSSETSVWPNTTITFAAHDVTADAHLTLSISRSSATDASGQIAHEVLMSGMSDGPDFSATFTPGAAHASSTFYWQVHRDSCSTNCNSPTWSFRVRPMPATGPSLSSPASGSTLLIGDSAVFKASDSSGVGAPYLRISRSPQTNQDGVIGNDVWTGWMFGGPSYTGTWSATSAYRPGTYYWQAYVINCSTPSYPDCSIESPVWSLTLRQYPPPSALSPLDGGAYRIGAPVTFAVGDGRPGARLALRISRSANRDTEGLIGTDVERSVSLSGGPRYSGVWKWSGTKGPGTYYWQAYRDECPTAPYPGCKAATQVRRLRITLPTAHMSVASRCYREQTLIPVAGSGFEPLAQVTLNIEGGRSTLLRADGRGLFSTRVRAPDLPARPGYGDHMLSASEVVNWRNQANLHVRVVALAASLSPSARVRRGQKVTHTVSGLDAGRRVYVHFVYARRVRATVALGRPRGACGMLRARAEMIPARVIRTGTWTLQYDTKARHSPKTSPRVILRVRVYRVPA